MRKSKVINFLAGGSSAAQRGGHGLERPRGHRHGRPRQRLPGALHARAAEDASQGPPHPRGHQALLAALHF